MNPLLRYSTPKLLLLGLVALLVFGSCGGGVDGFLRSLGARNRARLRQAMTQERQDRRAARQQLRGRARLEAYDRLEARTQARLDSFLTGPWQQRKLNHRWRKTERHLRHWARYHSRTGQP